MKNKDKEQLATEILQSFINQFGENQNHQQKLFIQFLSSVIVVLAAYALVYINMASFHKHFLTNKIVNENQSEPNKRRPDSEGAFMIRESKRIINDTTLINDTSLIELKKTPTISGKSNDAHFFSKSNFSLSKDLPPLTDLIFLKKLSSWTKKFQEDTVFANNEWASNYEEFIKKDADTCKTVSVHVYEFSKKDGNTTSYALIHLIIIYLFTQILMAILGTIILHMGYSYRRDQLIVNRIRIDALSNRVYHNIFGQNFLGDKKNFFQYQPNFNLILFLAIFFTQAAVYMSIYVYFSQFPNSMFVFTDIFFDNQINFHKLKIILASPLIIVLAGYWYFNRKYTHRVIKQQTFELSNDSLWKFWTNKAKWHIFVHLICIIIILWAAIIMNSMMLYYLTAYLMIRAISPYYVERHKAKAYTENALKVKATLFLSVAIIGFLKLLQLIARNRRIHVDFLLFYQAFFFLLLLHVIFWGYLEFQKKWYKSDPLKRIFLAQLEKEIRFFLVLESLSVLGYLTQIRFFEYVMIIAIFSRMIIMSYNNNQISHNGYTIQKE